MNKIKDNQYEDYDGDEMIDEDFDEADTDIEEDLELDVNPAMDFRRTWRDTEKYKEMRELHKLINDELYNGFNDNEFLENDL